MNLWFLCITSSLENLGECQQDENFISLLKHDEINLILSNKNNEICHSVLNCRGAGKAANTWMLIWSTDFSL